MRPDPAIWVFSRLGLACRLTSPLPAMWISGLPPRWGDVGIAAAGDMNFGDLRFHRAKVGIMIRDMDFGMLYLAVGTVLPLRRC